MENEVQGVNSSNSKDIDNRERTKLWQILLPTGMLLVATISMILTTCQMEKQVNEMEKATLLEWRPFLNISVPNLYISYRYSLNNDMSDSLAFRYTDSVKIKSDVFRAVEELVFQITFDLNFENSGKTPLRIVKSKIQIISEDRWVNNFDKSIHTLVDSLYSKAKLDSLYTDVPILPDSHSIFNKLDPLYISYDKSKISELIDNPDQPLVFYHSYFVEYKDFFGHRFNAVEVIFVMFKFDIKDGYLVHTDSKQGIEQYRWDVLLD